MGLIPACAGQTAFHFSASCWAWAHPRVCGADELPRPVSFACAGSSPRVRGRQPPAFRCSCTAGLIPACAGQTAIDDAREKIGTGSSPRVRGRLRVHLACLLDFGLIPACAGQTPRSRARCPARRAHPRVCGADLLTPPSGKPAGGSSPRVRGRRRLTLCRGTQRGLIPACAGQTIQEIHQMSTALAHPRVCGADLSSRSIREAWPGSSPRVRGRQLGYPVLRAGLRLIPACAGQTY